MAIGAVGLKTQMKLKNMKLKIYRQARCLEGELSIRNCRPQRHDIKSRATAARQEAPFRPCMVVTMQSASSTARLARSRTSAMCCPRSTRTIGSLRISSPKTSTYTKSASIIPIQMCGVERPWPIRAYRSTLTRSSLWIRKCQIQQASPQLRCWGVERRSTRSLRSSPKERLRRLRGPGKAQRAPSTKPSDTEPMTMATSCREDHNCKRQNKALPPQINVESKKRTRTSASRRTTLLSMTKCQHWHGSRITA